MKSALIVTSSSIATRVAPGNVAYSASKSFASYIAQGLEYELRGKVDVLNYEVGPVAPAIQSLLAISAQRAVDCCFRDLGHEQTCYGGKKHELLNLMYQCLPNWLVMRTSYYYNIERRQEAQDREE